MEKNQEMKTQLCHYSPDNQRLIGIVRFYDVRGFGFIDTNGFGIDSDATEKKTKHVELYFSAKDLDRDALMFPGDWVTFCGSSAI